MHLKMGNAMINNKMTTFSNRTIWRCGDASVHMPEVTLRSLHGWKSLGSRGVRALFTLFHLQTPPPNPSSWEEWTRSLKNLNDFKVYGKQSPARRLWVKIDPNFWWTEIDQRYPLAAILTYHIKSYQKESRKIGCLVVARHNPSKYESQLGYVFFAMPSVAPNGPVRKCGIPRNRPFQWGNDDNALRTLRRSSR